MRIALVGPPAERARLRAQLAHGERFGEERVEEGPSPRPSSIEIVAEYATVSEARDAAIAIDAILLAPASEAGRGQTAPRHGGRLNAASTLDDDAIEEALTARELEVLTLMAEGLTNKRIAERLGISDQTVKFHVAAIAGKLGAVNRTDAVRRGVRRGLVAL